MSRQCNPLFPLTVIAVGAVAVARFVTPLGAQAGAAANTLGVARTEAVDGDALTVDVLGTTLVETGAAIAAGAALETDASGRGITKAAGATVARLAPGESAGGAGELVEVILIAN